MDPNEPQQEPAQPQAWAPARPSVSSEPVPIPEPVKDPMRSLTDQWRAHLSAQHTSITRAATIDLPSGLSVRAKRPHLLLLLQTGKIPDTLAPRVESLIEVAQSGGEDAVKSDIERESQENPAAFYASWMNILDIVWTEAVIEPTFTRTPETEPDAIPISAVSEDDKTFLFMWCQGVDETVATFLDRVARAAPPVGHPSTSQDVLAGPGGDAGNESAA